MTGSVPREPASAVAVAIAKGIETGPFEVIRGGESDARTITFNRENLAAADEQLLRTTSTSEEAVKDRSPLQAPDMPHSNSIVMLQNKDLFPSLIFARAGGGEMHLPGDLAGEFGVILFHRGSWCPYCNAQLAAFARAADEFATEGIRVVSVSSDDREKSEALVAKHKLAFPVAYGADARAVSAVTGAFVNENPVCLQATGFILDPEGQVVTAVYSTRAIGRLMPDDVLNFVRHYKSLARNMGTAADWRAGR